MKDVTRRWPSTLLPLVSVPDSNATLWLPAVRWRGGGENRWKTSRKVRCDWLLCLTQLLAAAFCCEDSQDVVETVNENLWRS